MDKIEAYINSFEETFFYSLSFVTPDLPHLRDAAYRFWEDVVRYGPSGLPSSIRNIQVPVLKDFQIPPPPPPPVPPKSTLESSVDWIVEHPFKTSGIVIGVVVGAGLLVGYSASRRGRSRVIRLKAAAAAASRERRQVVVVLGGDHPFGLPLIVNLEKQGYIVIASVSSPDAVDVVERSCNGYVRALVLDPTELDTIPIFLRSLSSTLSRRFPLTAAGDPHASLSTHPYIHSVVSLLTIPSPTIHAPPAPLEHLSMRNTYLPYLHATHIAPFQVLQALLPLLRTTPARARDAHTNGNDNGKKTIVICLPAADARVGLPFASVQAMSAAATLRGAEVLRREINAVASTDKSESMKNIKVVVVDVGMVDVNDNNNNNNSSEGDTTTTTTRTPSTIPAYKAMEDWTASEKLTYGPAFTSIIPGMQSVVAGTSTSSRSSRSSTFWSIFDQSRSPPRPYGIKRRATDVTVFVDMIVTIVSTGGKRTSLSTVGLGRRIGTWFTGERFVVGAGAHTYRCASHLPAILLDIILNIPHLLISIRNALLPIPPVLPRDTSSSLPPPPPIDASVLSTSDSATATAAVLSSSSTDIAGSSSEQHTAELETSEEVSSEAEVESGLEEAPPNNRWVSLNTNPDDKALQA